MTEREAKQFIIDWVVKNKVTCRTVDIHGNSKVIPSSEFVKDNPYRLLRLDTVAQILAEVVKRITPPDHSTILY